MDRIEYLFYAIKNRLYMKKNWMIAAFSITLENEKAVKYEGMLQRDAKGPYFFSKTEEGFVKVYIQTPFINEPLYLFTEPVYITPDICPNLPSAREVSVGNLLFNLIALVEAFGKTFSFEEGYVNIGSLEDKIALKLKDFKQGQERVDGVCYPDQFAKFVDAVLYIEGFSQLCTVTATKKNIVSPPGIEQKKKALLKEYGDSLNDQTKLVEFQKKLQAYDEEWLKDDPSNGKFMSGKVKGNGRLKTKLTIGAVNGFDDINPPKPIINSLSEGWPQDRKSLASAYNDLRIASYARAKDTAQGGTAAKVLLRAANLYSIVQEVCNTTRGISYVVHEHVLPRLVGSYVRVGATWVHIPTKEDAKKYLNQTVVLRSPQYCLSPGTTICKHCAGDQLAISDNIIDAVTSISDVLLTASLKRMHNTTVHTQKLTLVTAFN